MPDFDLDSALTVPDPVTDLAGFVATRQHTDNIGAVLQDEGLEGVSGFVYMGSYYICDPNELYTDYWTHLERDEPVGPLAELEAQLFTWVQETVGLDA